MEQFKVSVVIPVYKAEKFVRRAVEAANAEEEVGEIILVEDCSPDDSLEVCRQLGSEYGKVKVMQHEDKKNHGCAASRNLGIQAAQFDFIALADADNFYLPGRFKRDKEIFLNDPSIDGVYSMQGVFYYSDDARKNFFDNGLGGGEILSITEPVVPEEFIYVMLGCHERSKMIGGLGIDAITLRKRCFDAVGLFDTSLVLQQDVHMFFRLAAKCRLASGQIDKPVALRGVHETMRSTDAFAQARYRKMRWRSLKNWFEKEIDDKDILDAFNLSYANFIIRNESKLVAFAKYISYAFKNPKILKEQYGFFDLNFFEIFGKNAITCKLVSAKNKVF
ncbi:MAG: glycosyltransferase [Candidatus Omnitrophica bacterium]|nr:glycosyltransferase [Candidatus Omnitrophota bacterium]